MDKFSLHFLKPGMLTHVQDMGRPGYQSEGVPLGGVMDQKAAETANWLVGNPLHYPVLEITLLGPSIAFAGAGQIAVTGANLSPEVQGNAMPMYETISLTGESLLTFGRRQKGCRAYLAIGGTWAIEKWLGSASTALFSGKVVPPNGLMKKGSRLDIHPSLPIAPRKVSAPNCKSGAIAVTSGPELKQFDPFFIGQFFSSTFQLSAASNRMGYRLNTPLLDYEAGPEIISSGTLPGTIQVTRSGQPIVLMKDAQTTGGYPRIAQVIQSEMDRLSQLVPGDFIRFELICLKEAYRLRTVYEEQFPFLIS